MNEQEKKAKMKEFLEKARKGVLRHLDEKGGSLSLGEMHDYSLKTYFIQHQRFSELMETFVKENLIEYDDMKQMSKITDKGKEFIK